MIARSGLPYYYVVFHYIGLFLGSVFALKLAYRKVGHMVLYFLFVVFLTFFFSCMLIFTESWSVPITITGAGFCIGVLFGLLNTNFYPVYTTRQYGGRYFSFAFILMIFFIVVEAIIINDYTLMCVMILCMFCALAIIAGVLGKDVVNTYPVQNSIKIRDYLRKKNNLPKIAFGLIWGFFWSNTYYAAVLVFQREAVAQYLNQFVVVIGIAIVVFLMPSGLIADTFGRRITILLGFMTQALAFLSLVFFAENSFFLIYIFPVILGIGFALSLTTGMLVFGETPEGSHIRDETNLFFVCGAVGMFCGVFIDEVMKPFFFEQPAYLAVVLLFIFVCATIVIYQMKETLPPKEELAWKDSVQFIYILLKASGLPIYSQVLKNVADTNVKVNVGEVTDDTLLGGALVAISSILKELAKNENPLKVIKKEGFTILVEEGEKVLVALVAMEELKIIRKKMREFLEEFQDFYRDLLVSKMDGQGRYNGDVQVFLPTKNLVKKHFG